MAETSERQTDWASYYAKTQSRPPRETILRALAAFDREELPPARRRAIDLGCGGGRDIPAFLEHGWTVDALDREPHAEEGIRGRPEVAAASPSRVRFQQADFAADSFAPPTTMLISASFALFNCPPERFRQMWQSIVDAIEPGGRFAGHLLGPKDSWAQPGDQFRALTYLGRADIDEILASFDVEWLWEEEDDSVTPRGEAKHWHVWHIVAKKRTDS